MRCRGAEGFSWDSRVVQRRLGVSLSVTSSFSFYLLVFCGGVTLSPVTFLWSGS